MRSLAKHLTPEELRILWILTAVILMGIGGKIRIASLPAADHGGGGPQGSTPAKAP